MSRAPTKPVSATSRTGSSTGRRWSATIPTDPCKPLHLKRSNRRRRNPMNSRRSCSTASLAPVETGVPSLARSLASYLSPAAWRMVMVDLRNHGKSAEIGLLPPHNLENAAKDLANLVRAEGWDWPDVVISHSMGGKIAMQFTQSCANGDYGNNVRLLNEACL